ncbi:MAG: oligoendopeptidase F [Lachnospiraceae bacterium]|nr:oligoendopeptidase F [Lachnospiraceae bacterium]MBR6666605.1 oligoendopeptidase F [Lachnospiraceae bacterium]
MAKELPKRSEVKEEFTWNLADMYANIPAWESDVANIQAMTEELAKMEGTVCASAQNLLTTLAQNADIERIAYKAMNYASRLSDQDTSDTTHQGMNQKLHSIISNISSTLSFIEPEILEADSAALEQFYAEQPALVLYRGLIDEIQRLKPHRLSAELEKVMAMTAEMGRTPSQTYSIFTNSDLSFPEMLDENGNTVRISHGRFIALEESSDRTVRKEAFEKLYATYDQYKNTLASLYSGQVKKQIFSAKMRKYSSTLEAAVNANNVSPSVYDNLIQTVNQNLDNMHRYVSLRKKLLGVDELHMYDIYTPMIPDSAKKVSYDEAKAIVLKALAPLGKDYVKVVEEGFNNRWIDVYENVGKRSGAYSSDTYDTHPFVLLNYNDTLDNMFTLAHEMGHAMHSYLSNKTQPFIYAEYKIFVAEVASTCNEILLMEYLLANTTDKKERAYLLNHYLDSFKGTVYRQTMFAEYERETNRLAEAGESLTADVLCKIYYDLNCKYYGPDMVSDKEIAVEWARIPHFYYNFYVYQYATGFASAVAIARNILKNGESAVKAYKEFLSGGCTKSPIELLKIAGVNLESPQPIQDALDVMCEILDEMEKLEL